MQISTFDVAGGAEKIAHQLHDYYRRAGHRSTMAVGTKRTSDDDIWEIPRTGAAHAWQAFCERVRRRAVNAGWRGIPRLAHWAGFIGRVPGRLCDELGLERFGYPGSRRLLELAAEAPDIVHAHNLHGGYFDLRSLPRLARQVPMVLTLHDAWLTTGHCAHSFSCERWRTGCGKCPDLTIPPSLKTDGTALNWKRKQRIFSRLRTAVATPSQWLMNRVSHSLLAGSIVESRVIPNGVDRTVFRPAARLAAREALGLAGDADVFMFSANGVRANPWKDFRTLREALQRYAAARPGREVVFMAVGEEHPPERFGCAELRFVPFMRDDAKLAQHYQAATAYVHAARADTFPNSVIESLACGTPVIATAVGGIPEQVDDGESGFLTPPGDGETLARRMLQLAEDPQLLTRMSAAAAAAGARFDRDRMACEYLDLYERCLAGRRQ